MAFDGIITRAAARELRSELLGGKVDKIYQPDATDISIYFKVGRERKILFATIKSSAASVRLLEGTTENPEEPYPFSMLLRKHLSGSKLISVGQLGTERVLEFTFERLNELGLMVQKRLIAEIMGKHSNIILINDSDYKILGSIKGVPSGINRVREVLPGRFYEYPPSQGKTDFDKATPEELEEAGAEGKEILKKIGGISPAIADELARLPDGSSRKALIDETLKSIDAGSFVPSVYLDKEGTPREFHIVPLSEYDGAERKTFPTLSQAMDYFYEHKESSSRLATRKGELDKIVRPALEKAGLKVQRLKEDLLRAENSGELKLYGELLTANLGSVPKGASEVTLTNYYDNEPVTIKLDPRWSASKNAQNYYRRYNKSKTAVIEKKAQLTEAEGNIEYLESISSFIDNASRLSELDSLRDELRETGFIRENVKKGRKTPKFKASPREYRTSDGFTVLVGRNNRENDVLTLEMAAKTDYWLHTKDIPGSHVIIRTEGGEPTETAIREAASLAAFYSKARSSGNVPVDYVKVRYVKKPSGAKPGMVIFTHNRTVYVDPKEPGK